jgi:hypothetical protein
MPKTIDKTKPGDNLKGRIKAIKDRLPDNWKEILCETMPEYDSLKGANILRNVISGKSTPSVELCEAMEKIAGVEPEDDEDDEPSFDFPNEDEPDFGEEEMFL